MCGHEHATWEYRTATGLDDDQLNELGLGGWELVSVEHGTFYLKRQRMSFKARVTLDQKRRYYALWNVSAGTEGDPR